MTEIQHRTKKDYALALIRDLIMRGELDPGAHIRQTDLAVRLKVSLTPVREALRQLEAEGLVAATAHRGVRMATTDPSTLRNVYLARRLVEPYLAARGTAALADGDVRAAGELLRRLEAAHGRRDAGGVRSANHDFHFLLYERADAALLLQMARRLWLQFPWDVLDVVPRRMDASRREHAEILDAMLERSPGRVERACALHIAQSYADVAEYLEPGMPITDPFPVAGDGPSLIGRRGDKLRGARL